MARHDHSLHWAGATAVGVFRLRPLERTGPYDLRGPCVARPRKRHYVMSQQALRQIEWRVDDPVDEWADVAIYIDGVSLIDLVKQYEEARDYIPAGGYGWSPVRWAPPESRHFFGDSTCGGKSLLLVCGCQCLGCWDFNGRIVMTPEYAEWTDFEQVHRTRGSPGGYWDYNGFGPFRFDRRQYEAALAAARPAT
jgi:hypothetical protein